MPTKITSVLSDNSGPNHPWYKDGTGYDAQLKMTEDYLTEEAKFRRRLFVAHFVKTTDRTAAAEFAGFKCPRAKGASLLKEPYVQFLLSQLMSAINDDAIMTREEIMFRLKMEACDFENSTPANRITALGVMAKIRGMLEPAKQKEVKANCVMIVPSVGSPDDWAAAAAKAQAELKASVRD